MAIDFPASPTNGQTFTSGSVTYTYDGTKWTALASGGGATNIISEGNTSVEVIDTGSDGRFVVTTEGSERLRVDSSGRLGIGSTSPGGLLEIKSADQNPSLFRLYNAYNTAGSSWGIDFYRDSNSGTNLATAEIKAVREGGELTSLKFGTSSTSGTVVERARIDSSGRLLVGTSSTYTDVVGGAGGYSGPLWLATNDSVGTGPFISTWTNSSSLDQMGTSIVLSRSKGNAIGTHGVLANGNAIGTISFNGSDGSKFVSGAIIRAAIDGTPGSNDLPTRLVFSTTADGASSPTERMRITQAGDVRIGTTAAVGTNVKGVDIVDNIASLLYRSGATTTSTQNHFAFFNPNGAVGNISTSASATAYTTSSDYRLKENVVPLTGAVDRLQQIPVHRFNFIADPETVVDGFIAHEAQAVVPECVTGQKDEVDADGNPIYQGIDQSKLVPLLTAALQEALAEIASLKDRVAALEGA
jgi:hypothetical protein